MTTSERPTAAIRRVDLSAPEKGASAARNSREDALFYAYRQAVPRVERRPCACGGMVKADPERPAPGVQAHNYTGRHKAWRSGREG